MSVMLQNSFSLSNLSRNVDNGDGGSLVAAVLPADCFWRQLRFGGNWLHIVFRRIVFGGSSDLAGTGSTLFSVGLFWRQLRFGGNWLHIIFQMLMLEFFYQGIFPRASWWMAYLLGCSKSKVRSRHSNRWPDNCTFFFWS